MKETRSKKRIRPCCGKEYVDEYEICKVCMWENDPVQLVFPDKRGGANRMSLEEAKRAFKNGIKVE